MRRTTAAALALVLSVPGGGAFAEGPAAWRLEFPKTDFDRHAVDYGEIVFDGATRDQIAPIYDPAFVAVAAATDIGPLEPVLSLVVGDDARAYPLRVLLFHEIVNDVVGGLPVLVTYCPLCNSGVVFDRRLDGDVLTFGNTGRLRHFDMVMYDEQTESWWQQFLGAALIGALTGRKLAVLPARLESLARFRARFPDGRVLVPDDPAAKAYGTTRYVGMGTTRIPLSRYSYDLPAAIEPTARVVVVGDEAWTLALLRRAGRIEAADLILTWAAGQNSVHDTAVIAAGRDVGNVVVQRRTADGLEDVPYDVGFAFAFSAFLPSGTLHHD